MTSRRHNPRIAKSLRCYSIAEAAELYGVHRNTVRHWLGEGLEPIDGRKPILIHGAEMNRFHRKRRLSAKRTCGIDELYCLPCRKPRRPALGIADYMRETDTVGALTAICPECERVMTQRVNAARLALFSQTIEVTFRPAHECLVG